jgi:hypothetical protein
LEDLVVDAELPVQMNAAKRQQFRWAKGGVQVAMKLMSDIMMHRRVRIDAKAQAFIQLTRHVAHPLFLAQFLIFPMLLAIDYKLYTVDWAPLISVFSYIMTGPGGYLIVINKTWGNNWREKAHQFFYLMFFSSGISVNNTVAVFDALFGKKNEFLRTPKFGIVNKGDDWRGKEYVLPFTKTTLLEIFFAIYGCMAVFIAIFSGNPIYAPMMAIPTIGFIYIAYLSIAHSALRKKAGAERKGDTRRHRRVPGAWSRGRVLWLLLDHLPRHQGSRLPQQGRDCPDAGAAGRIHRAYQSPRAKGRQPGLALPYGQDGLCAHTDRA